MKILICQLRSHGDIVRTFPAIDALQAAYPEAEISLTCASGFSGVAQLCPHLKQVIEQPALQAVEDHHNQSRICDIQHLRAASARLAGEQFDVFIDMHGVFQSALIGVLANIPVRVGRCHHTAKDGADLLYTHLADLRDNSINKMLRNLLTAQAYFDKIRFTPANPALIRIPDRITVVPGSSQIGVQKRWPVAYYHELIAILSQRTPVDVLLGPEEYALSEQLDLGDYSVRVKIHQLTNWSDHLTHFSRSQLVIGNDSAAMHLAIWKGIPAFTLFGPTLASISEAWEYNPGRGITAEQHCRCQSAWQGACDQPRPCMMFLTPQQVLHTLDTHYF